jgi:hypothetical protein
MTPVFPGCGGQKYLILLFCNFLSLALASNYIKPWLVGKNIHDKNVVDTEDSK